MEEKKILSERVELMFFDPKKDHDEYIEFQKKVRPEELNGVYSPLYLLRNEIYELTVRGQWFPAILLCHIAIDGIGTYFLNKRYEKFYIDYMGLKPNDYLAHRVYRNAREHNFGQLVGHLDKKWKRKIYNSVILSNDHIEKDINSEIKVVFSLSIGFNSISNITDINYIKGENSAYYKIDFDLNPNSFIEAFENGCEKLKEKVLVDPTFQKVLMEDLTEDNWMRVS